MAATDDWDGKSWTVDCVCGVTDDDGEEMVKCDECGVWVHTRCSRYVKSEKVFTCEKCRRKRGEENLGSKRRIWQVERAHVQGVVGGEGAGTGIFGSALWKASGYVPKKFGFQYKEFDWNDGNESGGNQGGENGSRGNEGGNQGGGDESRGNEGGNQGGGDESRGNEGGNQGGGKVSRGNEGGNGGALCLLKDIAGGSVSFGAGKGTEREESKKKKGEKGEEVDVRSSQQNCMKKSTMKSTMSYYGKHKKDDSRTSMDVSGKKKARAVPVERDDSKKRNPSASRSDILVSTPSSDAKRSEFHEGKGFKVDQNVIPSGTHAKIKGNVPAQPSSKGSLIKGVEVDESKNTLAVSGQTSETSCAVSTHKLSLKARQRDERDGLTATVQNSSKLCDGVQLLRDHNDSWSHSAKAKENIDLDNLKDNKRCINRSYRIRTDRLLEKESVAPYVEDSQNDYGSNGKMSVSCSKQNEAQFDINDSVDFPPVQSSPCDEIVDGLEHDPLPKKLNDLDKHTVAADCQIYNVVAPSEPNTTAISKLMQRSETVDHLNYQPSSDVNHTLQEDQSSTLDTPATLSDEELALLLHQELNSSARVPRVPRMRHAGSLPQLSSPTGANKLMKQSPSSSVGKDHGSVFKRKGKSVATERTQNSQELQDEFNNMKSSPLLPVQRDVTKRDDSARIADSVTKRDVDNGSASGVQSANKSNSPATSKQHVSSRCKSTQTASDDDSGTETRVAHRTLPGLLSEIVTKPMTYKELCDAVLPHWPNLRKNNGERYAYSSHSKAVLDCMRSGKEWARLVDRGPKSNAGRKRRERRFDAEAPRLMASLQVQFPKGIRKMRKRRRELDLQGGGLKDLEGDKISYRDSSLSSSSSEEGGFSSGNGTGTSSNGGPSGVSVSD